MAEKDGNVGVVQLLSIVLYSPDGEMESINFNPGRLNVITGVSKTGKSVLVKLIDYCLGRSVIPTSAGKVEDSLSWVGALWQLDDGGRAFVGRPLPKGQVANERAMLVIGDAMLGAPEFEMLSTNTDATTMRRVLGARIGIEESKLEPPPGSLRYPIRTNLGHAAFLCIQNQDEISSSTRIFHRSGEPGIDDTLRDTIPYFLGAVPNEQAVQKALLRQEQRRLQRLERELRDVEDAVVSIGDDLFTLLNEAITVGLAEPLGPEAPAPSREELILLLHRAGRDASVTAIPGTASAETQDAARRARNDLEAAEDELDQLMAQRSLLLDESEGSSAYDEALNVQVGRLTSLNLLPVASEMPTDDEEVTDLTPADLCPVCGEQSANPDPTSEQMRKALETLSSQLERIRGARPARSGALDAISRRIAEAQNRVQQARNVVETTFSSSSAVGNDPARRRDFTRGRIDAILASAPETDESRVVVLRERIQVVEGSILELQRQLSDDTARERLTTRLNGVGRELTKIAQDLNLEHSEKSVRIDLAALTVVAEVNDDPVPLYRIGSAENWIGYHIASHLALHQTFINHDRPVPRFLVIDQPSQGHYPSQMVWQEAEDDLDADDIAVRSLYRQMHTFVEKNAGKFQVIVVDHADFNEKWFRDSIVRYWRGDNEKLIPAAWIKTDKGAASQ